MSLHLGRKHRVNAKGETLGAQDCWVIDSAGKGPNSFPEGWYYIGADLTYGSRVRVDGNVHLILGPNVTMSALRGIEVPTGARLTIWNETATAGSIVANQEKAEYCAGIGGHYDEAQDAATGCGEIVIHGGELTCYGGFGAAGIGGAGSDGGSVTVNGGSVTALGGSYGAGIGGGDEGAGGSLTVNGGTVYAAGSNGAAGIGGGDYGDGGFFNINGGEVIAVGSTRSTTGQAAAGIGAGRPRTNGTQPRFMGAVWLFGGTVTAIAGTPAGSGLGAEAIGVNLADADPEVSAGCIDVCSHDYRVTAGTGEDASAPVLAGDRTAAFHNPWARFEPCQEHSFEDRVCIYCQYEESPVLHFEANGGQGHMADHYFWSFGNTVTLYPNAFTREGYSFLGWSTSPDGRGDYVPDCGELTPDRPLTLYAQWGQKISVPYLDENHNPATAEAVLLTENRSALPGGWYAVQGELEIEPRILCQGDVHLILTDGCRLTAGAGVNVPAGTSLTVYGQDTYCAGPYGSDCFGSGELIAATGSDQAAAIGGSKNGTAGDITIHGGCVTADGNRGAGIGSGDEGVCGSITITGGRVIARGGSGSAGIGGGGYSAGGEVVILGGFVQAAGSTFNNYSAAGIGAGSPRQGNAQPLSPGTVKIYGGVVIAEAGPTEAGGWAAEAIGANLQNAGSAANTLELAPGYAYCVTAGASESEAQPAPSGERLAACRSRYVRITPCDPHGYDPSAKACPFCGYKGHCQFLLDPGEGPGKQQQVLLRTDSIYKPPADIFTWPGYRISAWEDQYGSSWSADERFYVTDDLNLTARWEQVFHSITVAEDIDSGILSCGAEGGYYNSMVSVSVLPDPGFRFVKLTVNGRDAEYYADDDYSGRFRMPDEDVVIRAVFERLPMAAVKTVNCVVTDRTDTSVAAARPLTRLSIHADGSALNPEEWVFTGVFKVNGEALPQGENSFTMPEQGVTVEAVFEHIDRYEITVRGGKALNARCDTVERAAAGTALTFLESEGAIPDGMYCTGFLADGQHLAAGQTFTMPAHAVTAEAEYLEQEALTVNLSGGTGVIPMSALELFGGVYHEREGDTAVTYADLNDDGEPDLSCGAPDENGDVTVTVLPGAEALEDVCTYDLGKYRERYHTVTLILREVLTASALKIKSVSVSLQNNLSINYYVADSVLKGYKNPYVVFKKAKYSEDGTLIGYVTKKVSSFKSVKASDGTACHLFTCTDVTAAEMGSDVYATVYAKKSGRLYRGAEVKYSVLKYANSLLKKTEDAKLRTLLVDLLNYGAAAQAYGSYNLANPVNAGLTEEQRGYATQEDPAAASCKQLIKRNGATVSFKNFALSLGDSVAVDFFLDLDKYTGSIDDLEVRVKYKNEKGKTVTHVIDASEFVQTRQADGNDCCVAREATLTATLMRAELTVEVYSKSGKRRVSDTAKYSIESYVHAMRDSDDETLAELLNCMLKYGDSAARYFVG